MRALKGRSGLGKPGVAAKGSEGRTGLPQGRICPDSATAASLTVVQPAHSPSRVGPPDPSLPSPRRPASTPPSRDPASPSQNTTCFPGLPGVCPPSSLPSATKCHGDKDVGLHPAVASTHQVFRLHLLKGRRTLLTRARPPLAAHRQGPGGSALWRRLLPEPPSHLALSPLCCVFHEHTTCCACTRAHTFAALLL